MRHLRRSLGLFILVSLFISGTATAGKLPLMPAAESDVTVPRKGMKVGAKVGDDAVADSGMSALEIMKTKRRFGLGLTGGGGLGIMGIEGDINVIPELSISIGWGTGIDYSTFGVRARYYMLGEWVSPYIGLGFAHWWSDGPTANVAPAVLRNKFLNTLEDPSKGFSIFMAYPCVGVQFMHYSGFSFSAEVMALFKLFGLANGTYAGASAHWYF